MNNYYKETSQERRERRHEEDKIQNPSRHFLTKDIYTQMEAFDFCSECATKQKDLYYYDVATMTMRKKMKD